MLEFQGKYASCKVMIDSVEETAIKQIREFLDCPAFEGAQIRIMPDVHAGAGAVIGFSWRLPLARGQEPGSAAPATPLDSKRRVCPGPARRTR